MDAALQAITMPKWGMTMTEGRLAAWLVKEGDRISAGQEIMEVETEKITNVVEGLVSGLLRRIVVEEGSVVAGRDHGAVARQGGEEPLQNPDPADVQVVRRLIQQQ